MFRKYNKSIKIIYGSTTGNCEKLSLFCLEYLRKTYGATTIDVATINKSKGFHFSSDNIYLLCASTWGIEPATLQEDFEQFWYNCNLISIKNCCFIILALGDRYYPHFAYAATILKESIITYKGVLLKEALKLEDPWETKEKQIKFYLDSILHKA